jgi:hypothetical protein
MENVKPWQIVLIIIAFVALGFSVLKFGFNQSIESQMASEMMLMDAQTGQLYIRDISGRQPFIIPDRNPDSKEIALVPVFEENGEWFLTERYASSVDQLTVPLDAIPDPTKALKVSESKPIRLK